MDNPKTLLPKRHFFSLRRFFKSFSPGSLSEDPKRILIVKTSALGDIIHCYPVAAYLKAKFPGVKIDWVVEKSYAELIEPHPLINRAIRVNTRNWRKHWFSKRTRKELKAFRKQIQEQQYDILFDFQGNIKSALLSYGARAKYRVGFGLKTVPEWPNFFFYRTHYNPPNGENIRDDYLYLVRSFFKDNTQPFAESVTLKLNTQQEKNLRDILQGADSRTSMMVCPGAFWRNKQLSFNALLEFLRDVHEEYDFYFYFLWGSKYENELAENMHEFFPECSTILPRLPLPTLQNAMEQVDLVLAMDSLPLHLAGTTSTPTFSLFGPSSADKYCPRGKHHKAFQGACPYGKTFRKRCPQLRTCKTGACLRSLQGNMVFANFKEWWEARTSHGFLEELLNDSTTSENV